MGKKKRIHIPKKYRIIVYSIFIILCFVILLLFLPISFEGLNRFFIDNITKATGAEVKIDSTTVFLLRGFRIRNFSIKEKGAEKPILFSETCFVKFNLLTFLSGKKSFDTFYLYNAKLDLSKIENQNFIGKLISSKQNPTSILKIEDVQIANLELLLPSTRYANFLSAIQFKYLYVKIPTEDDIEFVIKGAQNNVFQDCFGKVLLPRKFHESKKPIKAYLTLSGVRFNKVKLLKSSYYLYNDNLQLNSTIRYISDSYILQNSFKLDNLKVRGDFKVIELKDVNIDSEVLYTKDQLIQITSLKLLLDEFRSSITGLVYLKEKDAFTLNIDFRHLSPELYRKFLLLSSRNLSTDIFGKGRIDGSIKVRGDLSTQNVIVEEGEIKFDGVSTYISDFDLRLENIQGKIKYGENKLSLLHPFLFEVNGFTSMVSGQIDNLSVETKDLLKVLLHIKLKGILTNQILEKYLSKDVVQKLKGLNIFIPLTLEGDVDFNPRDISTGNFDFKIESEGKSQPIRFLNLPIIIHSIKAQLKNHNLIINELNIGLDSSSVFINGTVNFEMKSDATLTSPFIYSPKSFLKPQFNLKIKGITYPFNVIQNIDREFARNLEILKDIKCDFDFVFNNLQGTLNTIEYRGEVKANRELLQSEPMLFKTTGQINFPFYFAKINTEITPNIINIFPLEMLKDFNLSGLLNISGEIKHNAQEDVSQILGYKLPFKMQADIKAKDFGVSPYFLMFRLNNINGNFKYDNGEITSTTATINAGNTNNCVVSGKADLKEKVDLELNAKAPRAILDDWFLDNPHKTPAKKFIPSFVNAIIEADEMTYKKYMGNNVKAEITFLNEKRGVENYFFDNISFNMEQGNVQGSVIYIHNRGEQDRVQTNVDINELNLGSFIRRYMNEKSEVEGKFAGISNFEVEVKEGKYTANGDGSFGIINCFFLGVPLFSSLAKTSGVNELNRVLFSDVLADFVIDKDKITTGNLHMKSNTIGINGYGSLGLDGELNLTMGLSFSKGFLGKLPIVKEVTKPIDKITELLFIYKATGNLNDPKISAVPLPPVTQSGKAIYTEMLKGFKRLGITGEKGKNK